MKKQWIFLAAAVVAAAVLLWLAPRYTLVGLACGLAGWGGHWWYAKRAAR